MSNVFDLVGGIEAENALLESETKELQLHEQQKTVFRAAFAIYTDIFDKIFSLPKTKENIETLLSLTRDAGNSINLFITFVNWDKQKPKLPPVVNELSRRLGAMKNQLSKFNSPISLASIEADMGEMERKVMKIIEEKDQTSSTNMKVNRHNELLQDIIRNTPEENKKLFKHIIDQEARDKQYLTNLIVKSSGQDLVKQKVVDEYFNLRSQMLDKVIKYLQQTESKLTSFIRGFKSTNVQEYQKKVQTQYAKYRPQLTNIFREDFVGLPGEAAHAPFADGIAGDQQMNTANNPYPAWRTEDLNIDEIKEFKKLIKNVATWIIQQYSNEQKYAQVMSIMNQISDVKLDEKQLLTQLIVPSIIFSQIDLIHKEEIRNEAQGGVGGKKKEQYTEMIRKALRRYAKQEWLKNNMASAGVADATLKQNCRDGSLNMEQITAMNAFIAQSSRQEMIDQIYDVFAGQGNDHKIPAQQNPGVVPGTVAQVAPAAGDIIMRQSDIAGFTPQIVAAIFAQIQIPNPAGGGFINGPVPFDDARHRYLIIQQNNIVSNPNTLELTNVSDIMNTMFTGAGTLKLVVKQHMEEDIIGKLCSQVIDATFSTLMITLQQFSTDQRDKSIAQIIGGAAGGALSNYPGKPELIKDAEIFYQLFQSLVIATQKYFENMGVPGTSPGVKIQLPYDSDFKDAFDFVIQQGGNIQSQTNFHQLVKLLNPIWKKSSESTTRDKLANKRTKSILQAFINDLMKGLVYKASAQETGKILNNIPIQKKIVRTTGFEDVMINETDTQIRADEFAEGLLEGVSDANPQLYGKRYQDMVQEFEKLIMDKPVTYMEDDEIEEYIKDYYSSLEYKNEKTRDEYIFRKFIEYNSPNGLQMNRLSNAFISEFGALYRYYFVYGQNVLKTLFNYHKKYVDGTLNMKYTLDKDGQVPKIADGDANMIALYPENTRLRANVAANVLDALKGVQYMRPVESPLFQAYWCATYETADPILSKFNAIVKSITVQGRWTIGADPRPVPDADNYPNLMIDFAYRRNDGETLKQHFTRLLAYYGAFRNWNIELRAVGPRCETIQKHPMFLCLWNQFQFIMTDKNKQIAYVLANMFQEDNVLQSDATNGGHNVYDNCQVFLNMLKGDGIYEQMFQEITPQTAKIGKIPITMRFGQANYAANKNEWKDKNGGWILYLADNDFRNTIRSFGVADAEATRCSQVAGILPIVQVEYPELRNGAAIIGYFTPAIKQQLVNLTGGPAGGAGLGVAINDINVINTAIGTAGVMKALRLIYILETYSRGQNIAAVAVVNVGGVDVNGSEQVADADVPTILPFFNYLFQGLPRMGQLVGNETLEIENTIIKYMLNQQYESVLTNWYYPEFIYPSSINNHRNIVEDMTQALPLVSYGNGRFEYSKLLEMFQTGQQKIMKKYDQFASQDGGIKQYYKTQLQLSTDIAGLIEAIFVHKIVAPIDLNMVMNNYMALQDHNYDVKLDFKFKNIARNKYEDDVFSYENVWEEKIPNGMPGMDKKSQPQISKTIYLDGIEDKNGGYSRVLYNVEKVNQYLKDWIMAFTADSKYKKLPKSILDQIIGNEVIQHQLQITPIRYRDFIVNIPINGFPSPFSLSNIQLLNMQKTDLKTAVNNMPIINPPLVGGADESNVKNYAQIDIYEDFIPRSDAKLILTILSSGWDGQWQAAAPFGYKIRKVEHGDIIRAYYDIQKDKNNNIYTTSVQPTRLRTQLINHQMYGTLLSDDWDIIQAKLPTFFSLNGHAGLDPLRHDLGNPGNMANIIAAIGVAVNAGDAAAPPVAAAILVAIDNSIDGVAALNALDAGVKDQIKIAARAVQAVPILAVAPANTRAAETLKQIIPISALLIPGAIYDKTLETKNCIQCAGVVMQPLEYMRFMLCIHLGGGQVMNPQGGTIAGLTQKQLGDILRKPIPNGDNGLIRFTNANDQQLINRVFLKGEAILRDLFAEIDGLTNPGAEDVSRNEDHFKISMLRKAAILAKRKGLLKYMTVAVGSDKLYSLANIIKKAEQKAPPPKHYFLSGDQLFRAKDNKLEGVKGLQNIVSINFIGDILQYKGQIDMIARNIVDRKENDKIGMSSFNLLSFAQFILDDTKFQKAFQNQRIQHVKGNRVQSVTGYFLNLGTVPTQDLANNTQEDGDNNAAFGNAQNDNARHANAGGNQQGDLNVFPEDSAKSYLEFRKMLYTQFIIQILKYQESYQQNYFTSCMLDLMINYATMLNNRNGVNPRFQGHLLSDYVKMTVSGNVVTDLTIRYCYKRREGAIYRTRHTGDNAVNNKCNIVVCLCAFDITGLAAERVAQIRDYAKAWKDLDLQYNLIGGGLRGGLRGGMKLTDVQVTLFDAIVNRAIGSGEVGANAVAGGGGMGADSAFVGFSTGQFDDIIINAGIDGFKMMGSPLLPNQTNIPFYVDLNTTYGNKIVQKIVDDVREQNISELLKETQLALYMYNEREQKIKEFDLQNNSGSLEVYNNQLLFMSNIYALLKSQDIDYSFQDKKNIVTHFIQTDFVHKLEMDIDSGLLNEKVVSILRMLQKSAEDFIRNNYKEIQSELEYRKLYNDYQQKFKLMINNQKELLDIKRLLSKGEDNPFYNWMVLEANYSIENSNISELSEYGLYKQYWFQLIKLDQYMKTIRNRPHNGPPEIDLNTPFQRQKMCFTRYTNDTNRYLGHDHFYNTVANINAMEGFYTYYYKRGITSTDNTDKDMAKNMAQLYRLNDQGINSISSYMHQQIYYGYLGLQKRETKLDKVLKETKREFYPTVDLNNGNEWSMPAAPNVNDQAATNRFNKGERQVAVVNRGIKSAPDNKINQLPFYIQVPRQANPVAAANEVQALPGYRAYYSVLNPIMSNANGAGGADYVSGQLHYKHDMPAKDIFISDMIYRYGTVPFAANQQDSNTTDIYPLALTLNLQLHSGITETDIGVSSTTHALAVFPFQDGNAGAPVNDANIQRIINYYNQLYMCFQNNRQRTFNTGKSNDPMRIFKIIGLDPINAMSLIKRNVSFPVINMLSLYMRKFISESLKEKDYRVGFQQDAAAMAAEDQKLRTVRYIKRFLEIEYDLISRYGADNRLMNLSMGKTMSNDFQVYNHNPGVPHIQHCGVLGIALNDANIFKIYDIRPKDKMYKYSFVNRHLIHIMSNTALFLDKLIERRKMGENYTVEGHKIQIKPRSQDELLYLEREDLI